jgi:hypothetical protein
VLTAVERRRRLAAGGDEPVPSAYDESESVERAMKIGEAGGSLSLARVIGAMIVAGAALSGIGYLFDLIVGPSIGMSGWWTVFGSGGFILGGMIQATREFAVPRPAERRALAAAAAAGEQAEAERAAQDAAPPSTPAADTATESGSSSQTARAPASTPD